jgi:hypothetical protein
MKHNNVRALYPISHTRTSELHIGETNRAGPLGFRDHINPASPASLAKLTTSFDQSIGLLRELPQSSNQFRNSILAPHTFVDLISSVHSDEIDTFLEA